MTTPAKNNSLLFKVIPLGALAAVLIVILALIAKNPTDSSGRVASFFNQFVTSGGPIVWFVLLPMSVAMVFLVINFMITLRTSKLVPNNLASDIISGARSGGLAAIKADLLQNHDLVSTAIKDAIDTGSSDWFAFKNAVNESLNDQAMKLLRRIEWLNLIGGISPMIGLFGTVFGMIKLFNSIVHAGGQPQPAQLAGGISVALVTTLWGLFIAIPAVTAYGIFRNRIESIVSDALNESERLLIHIRKSLSQARASTTVAKGPISIREIRPQNIPNPKNVGHS